MQHSNSETVPIGTDQQNATAEPARPLRRRVVHGSAALKLTESNEALIVKTAMVAEGKSGSTTS